MPNDLTKPTETLPDFGDFTAMFKEAAEAYVEHEPVSGIQFISTKNGRFALQEDFVGSDAGRTFKGIILGHVFDQAYYEKKYNDKERGYPVCFSLGDTQDLLAPHLNSPKPQSKDCKDCPMNKFGTADGGKGAAKACRQHRRLAVLELKETWEKTLKGPILLLRIPPTGLRDYSRYVKGLAAKYQAPPFAFLTQFSFDEDTGKVPVCHLTDVIRDKAVITEVLSRLGDAQEVLLTPYAVEQPDLAATEAPALESSLGGAATASSETVESFKAKPMAGRRPSF